jgi:hypothetical protein
MAGNLEDLRPLKRGDTTSRKPRDARFFSVDGIDADRPLLVLSAFACEELC